MRAARNTETEVVSQNRSDLSVQCSRSFFFLARCDMVDMLGRWGSDRHPPCVQDGGRGVGHPGSISRRLWWEGLTVKVGGRRTGVAGTNRVLMASVRLNESIGGALASGATFREVGVSVWPITFPLKFLPMPKAQPSVFSLAKILVD